MLQRVEGSLDRPRARCSENKESFLLLLNATLRHDKEGQKREKHLLLSSRFHIHSPFSLPLEFFLSHVFLRVLHKVGRFISLRGVCVGVSIQRHLVSLVDKLSGTLLLVLRLSLFARLLPPRSHLRDFLSRSMTFRKSYVNFRTTRPL